MWITEKHTAIEFSSDNAQTPVTEPMPQCHRGPKKTIQADYQGTCAAHTQKNKQTNKLK
jgi:hypothetical protein